MKLSKYFVRVVKYVVQLIVLFVILFGVMSITSKIGFVDYFSAFMSQRGLILLCVIIVFALAYPFFGFTKKRLTFDANKHVDEIENVMLLCGFIKVSQDADRLVYRAKTITKKIFLMFEDQIVISTQDGLSMIEGPRKEAVKASMRFETFITLNQ